MPRSNWSISINFFFYACAAVALVTIISLLLCCRRFWCSEFKFCKTDNDDVEIIVDADVIIQLEIEMTDIETTDPIGDDFYAQYNSIATSDTPGKQSILQGFGESQVIEDINPHAIATAVAREYGHMKPDDINACCVVVMDTVRPPSSSYDR